MSSLSRNASRRAVLFSRNLSTKKLLLSSRADYVSEQLQLVGVALISLPAFTQPALAQVYPIIEHPIIEYPIIEYGGGRAASTSGSPARSEVRYERTAGYSDENRGKSATYYDHNPGRYYNPWGEKKSGRSQNVPAITGQPSIPQTTPGIMSQPPIPQGAINVQTGEFYAPAAGGVVNPRTGTFHQDVGAGYINTQTGQFSPKIP